MKKLIVFAVLLFLQRTAFASGYGLNFTDMGEWVTFSALLNDSGQPITLFKSSWVVPPIPVSNIGVPAYLWNGLEPIDHSLVVQPVLEWDGSGEWAVSCYVVTAAGGIEQSPKTVVRPGDVVTGVVTLVSTSAGTFNYRCEFAGMPSTQLAYSGSELVLAVELLEQYSVYQCSDLSPGTKFSAIRLETNGAVANFPWHTFTNPNMPSCGQSTTIVNGSLAQGEVDIATHFDVTAGEENLSLQ